MERTLEGPMNVSRTETRNARSPRDRAHGGRWRGIYSRPADWETMRALAHRAVDDSVDYLRDVRERPVWRPIPSEVEDFLARPLPQDPQPLERVYEDFQKHVFPYPMGNIHPRFWGWVIGSGTPTRRAGRVPRRGHEPERAAAARSFRTGSSYQVCDWLKELRAASRRRRPACSSAAARWRTSSGSPSRGTRRPRST